MARLKKIKSDELLDNADNLTDTETTETVNDDVDDYFNSVYAEVGGNQDECNITLKVFRVVPNTGKMNFVFSATPAEMPILERLRDEFNGGTFEVRIYKNNTIYRRRTIGVEPPPKKAEKSTGNDELIRVMVAGFERMADKLANSNQNNAASMPQIIYDPAKVLEAMGTMMMSFQKMYAPAREHAPQMQANPVEQSMSLIMKGVELAQAVRPEPSSGEGSGMIDVLRDLIKSPLLANAMQPPIHTPRNAQPHTQPQPQPVKPAVHVNTQPAGDSEMNIIKKQYINMLLQKAREDASPELYAEYILDNAPEQIIRENFLGEENLQGIVSLVPEVANYMPWFVQLQNALTEFLNEPVEGELMPQEVNQPVS
jgi:hypothetical protein